MDNNTDDNKECKICLINGPGNCSINDVLLYDQIYYEETITIRHNEKSTYLMNDHCINISFDNIYLPFSECVIIVLNDLLYDYQSGQMSEKLDSLFYPKENDQAMFFVLLNYSKETPNKFVYSQNIKPITELLNMGYKVFILNVVTKEGRTELMEELILDSQKVQYLRKENDKKNKNKKHCIIY